MTAPTDVAVHTFVRRPIERSHGIDFLRCDLCSRHQGDLVHAAVQTSDDDMDPVSGLPYHDFVEGQARGMGGAMPGCKICGFDSAATVHNQPPFNPQDDESVGSMIDASQIAADGEIKKTKKGKHRYIHPRDTIYESHYPILGPGAPVCVACGKPAADPDHDGDNDSGDTDSDSGGTPQTAKFLPGIWTTTADSNGFMLQQAADGHTGTMVALFPKKTDARKVALSGDDAEDHKDLHVTMAFLPDFNEADLPALHHAVGQMAAQTPPIQARISGKGHFNPMPSSDDKPVTYASIDSPGLEHKHVELRDRLQSHGLNVAGNHGFTPHMTLAYSHRNDEVPSRDLTFDHITVAKGDQRTHFPLSGMDHSAMAGNKMAMAAEGAREHVVLTDRVEPDAAADSAPAERAFFTEVNGKTLLTAPAYMVPEAFQKAQSPNNFMKYMAGRFVGGEQANRNGAFWSVGDLEFGMPTVAHGPLNWLHEARHIIGTITAADLVKPTTQQAAAGAQPHIQAMSGMWAWIYPDEVSVIEQASDQGKLFYSMECVSNEVECVGEGSCGTTVGYLDYIRNGVGTCQHMKQRAGAARRFAEPTFLGGAAIVPPVRPGWADAHASVMQQAASLAEKAFEQAGQPDVSASDWELLMSQVLLYAGVE